MEVEEIQTQPPSSKFSRVNSNGRTDSSKIGQKDHQYADDEEEGDLNSKMPNLSTAMVVSGAADAVNANRLRGWHQSRIIRVARASGGKDRHSKVWTSKGLRDRRVRLSVTTAIQFYDLQDRLGYDQPSKAVEWLIKAAADAINELPSLNGSFPETPKQLSDEKRASDGAEQGFDSADVGLEDPNFNQNQSQHLSLSKSACSSTSDTSKGSGLSLLKSDVRVNRVKARERARERAAKEKEKDSESRNLAHQQSMNHPPISQNSSFTELLTAGISSVSNNNTNAAVTAAASSPSGSEVNLFRHKAAAAAVARQWPLFPEYFGSSGLLGPSTSRTTHQPYSGQIQLGNSMSQAMPMPIPSFSFSGENHHHHEHQQFQHFPFVSDHLIPVAATTQSSGPSGDYNLNFTMSSGLAAGFNRGTLQSNSSSQSLFMPPHLQRFSASTNSPMDGSTNVPFFIGATAAPPPSMENQHYHQFPPGLHLYGDGRHSEQKPKEKN